MSVVFRVGNLDIAVEDRPIFRLPQNLPLTLALGICLAAKDVDVVVLALDKFNRGSVTAAKAYTEALHLEVLASAPVFGDHLALITAPGRIGDVAS